MDLIDRQAALDLFPDDDLEWDTNCGYVAPHFAKRMIKELPSAQPEIIRCKDCYHYPGEYTDCPMIGWARNENDFCSKAERREENHG